MRLLYPLVVFLSAVAFVAAAPYPKELSQNDIAVANQESQPLTKAQLKSTRRHVPDPFRAISKRRTQKKRSSVPRAAPTRSNSEPSTFAPGGTGRTSPVSKTPSSAQPAPTTGSSAAEAPPVEDDGGKGVKKHHRPPPKPKKKKQPKPKHHDDDDDSDDTGSDDDPGTDNLSEDADGTDRDD